MAGFGDAAFGTVPFGSGAALVGCFGDGPFGTVPFGVCAAAGGSGTGSLALGGHTAAGSGSTGATGASGATLVRSTAAGSGETGGIYGSAAVVLVRHTGFGFSPVEGDAALSLNRHTLRTSGPIKAGPSQPRPILTRLSVAGKREALRSFDTTRWLDPNFSGSWTNSINQQNVQYSRSRGRVFVRGVAASGTGEVFVFARKSFGPPVTLSLSVGSQVFTVAALRGRCDVGYWFFSGVSEF